MGWVRAFPLSQLLPGGPFFRYEGSLTTPPCSERVVWSVYLQPLPVTQRQVGKTLSHSTHSLSFQQQFSRWTSPPPVLKS